MHRSPLHPSHERLGARFTPFGDWEMPLQYEGTVGEHHAVRDAVGVFDVSHLGRFIVEGEGAVDLVDGLLCNELRKIGPGRTQYTMLLNDTGGVVDDIIVWWLDPDRLVVLPNGANHDRVLGLFSETAPSGTVVRDMRSATALLAVQGPEAPSALEAVIGTTPGRNRVEGVEGDVLTAGTGYTGEAGAEVMVPADAGAGVFDGLLAAGAVPCGLGARDTLRLEMGFPLWGQDLDETTTPLEAGMAWVIGSGEYPGSEAIRAARSSDPTRRLVGFALDDRRPPRHGSRIRSESATGMVTSGNFSPTLGRGIGMAYMSPPVDDDTSVEVEIRGRWYEGRTVAPPFLSRP